MDYYTYDEEVPAGFQEADILQAEYEAEGRRIARLHRHGICTHGSQLARKVPSFYDADDIAAMRQSGMFPERPTDERVTHQASIPEGYALCTDCGKLVPDRVPAHLR